MNTSYIADRARYLKLAAISISEGMRTGGFRSCFRGQGIEFDGVREYERGDDIRSIDWKRHGAKRESLRQDVPRRARTYGVFGR